MSGSRKAVLVSGVSLFALWTVLHLPRLTGAQDGAIRFALGLVFALLILFRRKVDEADERSWPGTAAATAVCGALFCLGGLIVPLRQLEWFGLVLLLYSCLRWALPKRWSKDVLLAMLLLYWVHPLPGQVFGRLQLGMQFLSIQGAEWVLHCANVRAWADGLTLHTGYQSYGVPESCSGMRTAATVLLMTFGVTTLFRFSRRQTIAFLGLGLAQVLALNIARISLMVIWSQRMPVEWSETFLHDTLGILLLVTILVVQIEASWWRIRCSRRAARAVAIERGEAERPDRASRLPKFWVRIMKWGWLVVLVVVVAAGVYFLARKSRTAHRGAMVAGVIDSLIMTDLEKAERAIAAAMTMLPGDRELVTKRVHALILRGRFEEAVARIDLIEGGLTVVETILKSWACMALGRPEDAVQLVGGLDPATRKLPGVAIINAEYSAIQGDPEEVSRNVKLAAHSHVPMNRVRALFPYLALHEQWDVIVACDDPSVPYREFSQALMAVQSCLRMRDVVRAASSLKQALTRWPEDPRFLGSLFLLASMRPGGEWEGRFAENFLANVSKMNADLLATYINYCFKLGRPDLSWLAFLRLRGIDPADPALALAAAQHGEKWCVFRRYHLGIGGRTRDSVMSLFPVYRQTRGVEPFKSFWNELPLMPELFGRKREATQAEYVHRCLEELRRREEAGQLSLRLQMTFPTALALDERYDEAHRRLDNVGARYPRMMEEILFQHAALHDQQAEWEKSYEALARYSDAVDWPNLTAEMMKIHALMNLDLGIYALELIRRAREEFPGAAGVDAAMAAVWDAFGFKEQALFVLEKSGVAGESPVTAQLLYDTGRWKEAGSFSRALGVGIERAAIGSRQPLLPRPAEQSTARMWPAPMSADDMSLEADRLEKAVADSVSPFTRRLSSLLLEWYRAAGQGDVSDPARWREGFRNQCEEGAALYRLAMALARQGHHEKALAVTDMALEKTPRSLVLWRVKIALTEGDISAVEQARAACPDDPEIWLASLVTHVKGEDDRERAEAAIGDAVAFRRFAPGTIVRAGDYLLRCGLVSVASVAAADATERCRGLLTAYVLGFKCALHRRDLNRALSCALRGVENANDPAPFYKAIVLIKALKKSVDADMLAALEYLQERFSDDFRWSESLGFAYFQKGDVRRTLSVLAPIIRRDIRGIRVQSLLLAAESARLEGSGPKSRGILETAHALYPDKLSILNNLIYSLAQDRATVRRARELLPGLLRMGGESYAILDTAAVVYLRSGQLDRAREYSNRAMSLVGNRDYASLEVRLNAAEILFRSGQLQLARTRVESVRRARGRSRVVDLRARELLAEIETTLRTTP